MPPTITGTCLRCTFFRRISSASGHPDVAGLPSPRLQAQLLVGGGLVACLPLGEGCVRDAGGRMHKAKLVKQERFVKGVPVVAQ